MEAGRGPAARIQRTHAVKIEQTEVWWSFFGVTLLDILLLAAAAELLIRILRDRYMLAERSAEIAALNADLEERVAQRTRELNTSNQELEAFSYSVSHDLRAPLRTIDGFSLALEEDFADKLNDEGRDYITRVRTGVQRMGQLIDALLQLSRVTRSELQTEPVDLSSLATLVFNELQSNDPYPSASPFWRSPDVAVQADPRLLRIALENLIGNAWKFTSKNPDARIEFGVGRRERPHRILHSGTTVRASICSTSTASLPPFSACTGTATSRAPASGWQPSRASSAVTHGIIGAESEIGRGATFFFSLSGDSREAVPLIGQPAPPRDSSKLPAVRVTRFLRLT